jgi:hypothetical protein
MNFKIMVVPALVLATILPAGASPKNKKKGPHRAMVERMEAVPCGAKQRGFTGIGGVFASLGIEAVNSEERLCPQYMLRTDDAEYHIRPVDKKHAPLLPVGEEGEFKIKKNRMYMKIPDGDRKKRAYEVVAMKPLDTGEGTAEGASYKAPDRPTSYRAPEQRAGKGTGSMPNPNSAPPPQQ